MCLIEQLSMSPAASPRSWFNTSLILSEISTGCSVIWFDSPVLDEKRDRKTAMEIKKKKKCCSTFKTHELFYPGGFQCPWTLLRRF